MLRKLIVVLAAAGASLPLSLAAQTVKVGLINSYTGFVAQPADQGQKGFDLYVKEHAKDLPPGVKIELLRRDDTSNPEVGKRLAQECCHWGAADILWRNGRGGAPSRCFRPRSFTPSS